MSNPFYKTEEKIFLFKPTKPKAWMKISQKVLKYGMEKKTSRTFYRATRKNLFVMRAVWLDLKKINEQKNGLIIYMCSANHKP